MSDISVMKQKHRYRKGFYADLKEVFSLASCQVGCGDPSLIDHERRHIAALEKELFKILREARRP